MSCSVSANTIRALSNDLEVIEKHIYNGNLELALRQLSQTRKTAEKNIHQLNIESQLTSLFDKQVN